jgi:tetratricopeptide (TPR) repeat protein
MRKLISRRVFFLLIVNVCLNLSVKASEQSHWRSRLDSCISSYKDGDYQKTADSLQALLPSLTIAEDRIEAYKYLGFSYGMLNRIDRSKEVFKTVLDKYPAMEIDTLEVPPNIAIIFKQAKLEKKIEKIDASRTGTVHVVVQKKNVAAPVVLLSVAIISAAAGADLFYYGNQQYQNYKSVDIPDQSVLDRYYASYRNAYIAGSACAAVTAVLLPVSLYLFMKKDHPKKGVTVSFVNGCPSLVYVFSAAPRQ